MALDAMAEITDEALLVLYAQGDSEASRALTLRLAPRGIAQAYRLLGDRAEAEDVAQDAMLRLWKIAPDWRQGEAKVTTWLFRVTANLCTDRYRKGAKSGPTAALEEAPEAADGTPSAAEALLEKARAEALQQALADLPERQRQAVVLRLIDGIANPEIAEIMDISVEAVESLTARGKRALAAALAPRRHDLGFYDD